jgi:hypothetical protein
MHEVSSKQQAAARVVCEQGSRQSRGILLWRACQLVQLAIAYHI